MAGRRIPEWLTGVGGGAVAVVVGLVLRAGSVPAVPVGAPAAVPAQAVAVRPAASSPVDQPPAVPGRDGAALPSTVAAGGNRATSEPAPAGGPGIAGITFVDPLHGWALVGDQIIATGDGGSDWIAQYTGYAAAAPLDFVDSLHGWAGPDLRTADGGQHWQVIQPVGPAAAPNPQLTDLDFVSATVGWALAAQATGAPALLRTTDGGLTWGAVPLPAGAAAAVCFADPSSGWVAIGPSLYATTDGGGHWTPAYSPPPPPQTPYSAQLACGPGWVWALFTGTVGIEGTEDLVVRGSVAGGVATWRPVLGEWGTATAALAHPPQPYVNGFSAANATTAGLLTVCGPCAAGQSTTLSITTDGGRTWHSGAPVPPLSRDGTALTLVDATRAWVTLGGGRGGVLEETADGGRTWAENALVTLLPGVTSLPPSGA